MRNSVPPVGRDANSAFVWHILVCSSVCSSLLAYSILILVPSKLKTNLFPLQVDNVNQKLDSYWIMCQFHVQVHCGLLEPVEAVIGQSCHILIFAQFWISSYAWFCTAEGNRRTRKETHTQREKMQTVQKAPPWCGVAALTTSPPWENDHKIMQNFDKKVTLSHFDLNFFSFTW